MDAGALFTFFLKLPAEIRTVELFGSWDNFARPYKLDRDLVRGRSYWTGCHKFKDIVFDGDCPEWRTPRRGPLKQGGRYWYFYRLDDVEEHCDPAHPISSECPLLPGQTLNILEVPVEISTEAPQRSASADLTKQLQPVMSYDPDDRYKKVEKPSRLLHRVYSSTEDLSTTPVSAQGSRNDSHRSKQSARDLGYTRKDISHLAQQSASLLDRGLTLTTPNATSLDNTLPTSSQARLPSVRVFGPSMQMQVDRPSTRPGSDYSDNASSRSYFTVQSRLYNNTQKALPPLPPPSPMCLSTLDDKMDIGFFPRHESHDSAADSRGSPAQDSRDWSRSAPSRSRLDGAIVRPPILPKLYRPAQVTHTDGSVDFLTTQDLPRLDLASYEMTSPTFSADTISTPGDYTPHRLSAQFDFEFEYRNERTFGSASLPPAIPHLDSETMTDDVERRFSQLRTEHDQPYLDELQLPPSSRFGVPSSTSCDDNAAGLDLTYRKDPKPGRNVYALDDSISGSGTGSSSNRRAEKPMASPGVMGRIWSDLGFLRGSIR